jgi:hypothetical protein
MPVIGSHNNQCIGMFRGPVQCKFNSVVKSDRFSDLLARLGRMGAFVNLRPFDPMRRLQEPHRGNRDRWIWEMVVLRHFGARIPGAIRAARPQNGLNMGGVCRRNACLFWHAAVGFPSAIRCSAQEICGLSRTVSCVSDIDVKPFAGSITYRTASTLHGAAFTRQFNWLARAGTGGASRSSMVNKIRISGEQDRESNRVI